ncbi:arginine--tRNA ligase [Lachnospiraceae bacterium YH-ros2228]|nr:arginine--tRNA ligase [Lachnospiraceae bacterium]MDD6578236.1 arginine--tRNA ligase [Lachnospiraceae bacterium]
MKELIDLITDEMKKGFVKAGYDDKYANVTVSNRPDLCEYQCNGAMPAAKEYHKAPLEIAREITAQLEDSNVFSSVEAVKPGFINLKIQNAYLSDYVNAMRMDHERCGADKVPNPKTIMIDYGGPNVAKPLHVGHLRSAVIGESIKRILSFAGNRVIGDIHLGDWGTQMGLIITELKLRKPDLVYFEPDYDGDYPTEPPFTISELEEIYPTASKKSKEDEEYHKKALEATAELQKGRRGYRALLSHILNVSVTDLKKNYERLNVSFELWKGESDAQPYIAPMVKMMKDKGLAYESEGALVVDVKEDSDKKEIPPCMILKSDGAALYNTTDLATLVWRMEDYHPDKIVYVVDKRQELHFVQVFRCARKTGIVGPDTELDFVGFGTMNGKDGGPFKTRDGGVMRLSLLLDEVNQGMYERIKSNSDLSEEEAKKTAKQVALAAIKYGDLMNQASKDYIFDIDRFSAFEGNTGPYILYTIVRIKSILNKYKASGKKASEYSIQEPASESEKDLMLILARFNQAIRLAAQEMAPHKVCAYVYDLAEALNRFYHETRILSQENESVQGSYINLLDLTRRVLEQCIDLLGFSAPERM